MKLHEAVAATYAAVGQELSDLALTAVCMDLKGYPPEGLGAALQRCRKELKRISLVDIIDRIPGGLPGPEEAWAIVAPSLTDESKTLVWTDEMAQAFGVALGLQDDPIAARMAFKEAYARLRSESRDAGKPVTWRASLGHDPQGREGPLLEAAEKGRLTMPYVQNLLPNLEPADPRIAALLAPLESKLQLEVQ